MAPSGLKAKSLGFDLQLRLLLILSVLFFTLPAISCSEEPITLEQYYHSQIKYRARPYNFDYLNWEMNALATEENDNIPGFNPAVSKKELLENIVKTLDQEKIAVFPPLNVYIGKPPMLLVVSPRDRIEYFDRVVLSPGLSLSEIDRVESSITELGLSGLVTDLGGFGALYPPVVAETKDLNYIISDTTEEWLHQYMVFRPLGFLYLLDSIGIPQDPDVVIMNETMVGIVSEEVGNTVYRKYYAKETADGTVKPVSPFSFNDEMRKTRAQLDRFLAKGDIQGGENYLEIQRLIFESHGYRIRKLNQAYFAFHGIYAYDPAAVSPIYRDMEALRSKSGSLSGFLDRASGMTTYADLLKALNKLY
jgi:hypothetical protein